MSTQLLNPFSESRLNRAHDYRPEWDVPSLNQKAINSLVQVIREAGGRTVPNPGQRIPIILAAPGYGKTHLFGRIGYDLRGEVLFIHVPGIEDLDRPVDHIARFTVDALFRSTDGQLSPLARALAQVTQQSFLEYFGQFPPSLAPRFQPLALALKENPDRIQDVLATVKELAPYQKLASSIAVRLVPPTVPDAPPLEVLRALALGWSPVSHLACRWLKGESLPENELDLLGLGEENPQPIQVLQGIAAILQYRTPVVICCDQLELALIAAPHKIRDITAKLMSILEKVPNHVLVISCLEAEWTKADGKGFFDNAFTSFKQRTYTPLKLDSLKEDQAIDLVAKRLESWQPVSAHAGRLWPFDDASLLTYVREKGPTPRWLIQQCETRFNAWLENGQQGLIYLSTGTDIVNPAQQFLRLWNAELEQIREDPQFCVEDYSVQRLQRAIREALCLARESLREMSGLRVKNIKEDVVKQVKSGGGGEKRYSFAVEVETSTAKGEVVVPVTDLNNSLKFTHYLSAVTEQITDNRVGAILIHRLSEFVMGPKTHDAYDKEVEAGRLRLFAMEDNPQTLERLECLLRFLDRAGGRELQIGSRTLSVPDCQALILETAVLDNLDLFKALGAWRKLQSGPKPVASSPPSTPPPVAPQPPRAEPVPATVGAAKGVAPKPVVAPMPKPAVPTPVSPLPVSAAALSVISL